MFGQAIAAQTRSRIDPPTWIGISAVLMWSATVGLYRNIAEIFGPEGGAALIFTTSGLIATLHGGRRAFRGHSPRYLLIGGAMFVTYEIALALAVGFAATRQQAIEVGMVNYLWPSFTIALAVIAGIARGSLLLIPGVLISLCGVVWASSGGAGLSLAAMSGNIGSNPLPYLLGLVAAVTWPLYTVYTRKAAGGRSAVPPFLLLTAVFLWGIWWFSDAPALHFDLRGAVMVLTFGILTTLAYSAWTHGASHGNLTIMATASYFSPILSVLLSSILLGMLPGPEFWLGAATVTAGSLICWAASR